MSAEQELRQALMYDLLAHLHRDASHAGAYMIGFLAREASLAMLEKLVDELDADQQESDNN